MDIQDAMKYMKNGARIRRQEWPEDRFMHSSYVPDLFLSELYYNITSDDWELYKEPRKPTEEELELARLKADIQVNLQIEMEVGEIEPRAIIFQGKRYVLLGDSA